MWRFVDKFHRVFDPTYDHVFRKYQSKYGRMVIVKLELRSYTKRCHEMKLQPHNLATFASLQRRRYLKYQSYLRLKQQCRQLEKTMERIIRRVSRLGGSSEGLNAANTPKRRKLLSQSDASIASGHDASPLLSIPSTSQQMPHSKDDQIMRSQSSLTASTSSTSRWRQHQLQKSPTKAAADRLLKTTKQRLTRNTKRLSSGALSSPEKKKLKSAIKKDEASVSDIVSQRSSMSSLDEETKDERKKRLARERQQRHRSNMDDEARQEYLAKHRLYNIAYAPRRVILKQQKKMLKAGIRTMEMLSHHEWDNVAVIMNGMRKGTLQRLFAPNKTENETTSLIEDILKGTDTTETSHRIAYLKLMAYGHYVKRNGKRPFKKDDFQKVLIDIHNVVRMNAVLLALTEAELSKCLNQLRNHLAASLYRHPRHNDAEHLCFKITHLRYHIVKKESDEAALEDVKIMDDLYPHLYREQVTGEDPEPGQSELKLRTLQEGDDDEKEDDESLDTEELTEMMAKATIGDCSKSDGNDQCDSDNDDNDDNDCNINLNLNEEHLEAQAVANEAEQANEIVVTAPHLDPVKLGRLTLIRRCKPECPEITVEQAAELFSVLNELANTKPIDFSMTMLTDVVPLLDCSVEEFLRKHAPCCSGLRTIQRRISDIRRYGQLFERITSLHDIADFESLDHLCRDQSLPKFIQEALYDRLHPDTEELHSEDVTRLRFGANLAAIKKELEAGRTKLCDICDTYHFAKYVTAKTSDQILEAALPPRKRNAYNVCKVCRDNLRKSKVPPTAIANFMEITEFPKEFTEFNWLENNLIRRVHSPQNMVNLHDKGGRKTQTRAVRGPIVFLPVPLEGTFGHVAKTLPENASTIIHVSTKQSTKLVNLPRVIECLKWLKHNNHLYSNVEINETFTFQVDVDVKFTQTNLVQNTIQFVNDLIDTSEDAESVLKHENVTCMALMDVHDRPPPSDPYTLYSLQKTPYKPLGIDHPHLDCLTFPHLHPTGQGGYDDERRPPDNQVRLRQYIHNRLTHHNRIFAMNPEWLCFMYGLTQQIDIRNSMSTAVRISKDRLTADQVAAMKEGHDDGMLLCTSSAFNKLRGHQPYWIEVRTKLKAHIAMFGEPTFFVTINPALDEWQELHDEYGKIHNCNVDRTNIDSWVSKDPWIFTQHFQHRLKTVLNNLILANNSPFGEVTHYFYRIEYQARGHQHAHMLLWVKNAPGLNATPEEIAAFIDEVITARMPSPKHDPELYRIVSNRQNHWKNHSGTCLRQRRNKKGIMKTICRFDFPRPIKSQTEVIVDEEKRTNKFYYLKRRKIDQWINDYCPSLTLALCSNTDVQYISRMTDKITDYISGYATKHEKSQNNKFIRDLLNAEVHHKDLFATYMKLLRQREVGAMEMVDLLMGHHLYEFDATHVKINTNESDKRYRILKTEKDQKPGEPIYVENWEDDHYKNRPDELRPYSLATCMMNFNVSRGKPPQNNDNN